MTTNLGNHTVPAAGVSTPPEPQHRDENWSHIPVKRATDESPRRALIEIPRNLIDADEAKRRFSNVYWGGSSLTWEEAHQVVAEGKDVALLPQRSGLVILDCDVKRYDDETGFVVVGNVASLAPPIVKYGLNDLRREVERLGHSMKELATYAVSTKSGGYHLFFATNPRFPLETKHHRHDWRVDVIASENSWIATVPTAGYTVARDLPVAMMPDWLAQWLQRLEDHIPPLGRRRRQQMVQLAQQARHVSMLPGREDDGLMARYVQLELDIVTNANQFGGWNETIYQCCRNLFDVGWQLDPVSEAVLVAAEPVNELERRKAVETIQSAWRGHQRDNRGATA